MIIEKIITGKKLTIDALGSLPQLYSWINYNGGGECKRIGECERIYRIDVRGKFKYDNGVIEVDDLYIGEIIDRILNFEERIYKMGIVVGEVKGKEEVLRYEDMGVMLILNEECMAYSNLEMYKRVERLNSSINSYNNIMSYGEYLIKKLLE